MGNSQSQATINSVNELVHKTKFDVVVKCLEYVDFMELTSAQIDSSIEDLQEELAKITEAFSRNSLIDQSPAEFYREIVGDLEKFVNGNKFSVRRLFAVLEEACAEFQTIANNISPVDFSSQNGETFLFFSDDDALTSIRALCSTKIANYYGELTNASLPYNIMTSRMSTLRRMLYKEANVIVEDVVKSSISEFRNSVFEDIDNIFCLAMTKGYFSLDNKNKARGLIKVIISLANEGKEKLEFCPYTKIDFLNTAIDEISFHVEKNILRTIQG